MTKMNNEKSIINKKIDYIFLLFSIYNRKK